MQSEDGSRDVDGGPRWKDVALGAQVVRVAKSQAIQRCGRAGRSRAGKCFRIYSAEDFDMYGPR